MQKLKKKRLLLTPVGYATGRCLPRLLRLRHRLQLRLQLGSGYCAHTLCAMLLLFFFLVHLPAAALDAKKCIWAKTTRQTCRPGCLSVERESAREGVGVAWHDWQWSLECTAPSPYSCSRVIKRAVALEPPPGPSPGPLAVAVPGSATFSGFGECILSRLVGRYVCLRQLQITLSDTIVLGLALAQGCPSTPKNNNNNNNGCI